MDQDAQGNYPAHGCHHHDHYLHRHDLRADGAEGPGDEGPGEVVMRIIPMLAVAMLGAVSLGVMKLTGNLSSIQTSSRGVVDEADLANLVNLIVTDAMDCKVSLAGNDPVASPVIFQKINIDDIATEGLDVELWVADQAGTARKSKRVSASDANFTKFGALKMDSIKLVLNNGSGTNYTVNPAHSDVGVLRLKYSKACLLYTSPSPRD